jgi:hypothetical protein
MVTFGNMFTHNNWRSVLVALAVGLGGGAGVARMHRSGPRPPVAPIGVPTHIEVWRPTPLGGSAVPSAKLTVYRVIEGDGDVSVDVRTDINDAPAWRIVLIGDRRVSLTAAPE